MDLFGEMLQGGGNPWRGMVFGMTSRLGLERRSAGPLEAVGRVRHCPCPHDRLLGPRVSDQDRPGRRAGDGLPAEGKTLAALGSWSPRETACRLAIDFEALGLDPRRTVLDARLKCLAFSRPAAGSLPIQCPLLPAGVG